MRVLVCGGRDYGYKLVDNKKVRDIKIINFAIDTIKSFEPTFLIHGGTRGGDEMAIFAAECLVVPIKCFPANWDYHGRAAGPIRNQQMLDEGKPDLVVAFPGGTGTADMVRRARKAGVEVVEVKE